MASRLSAPRLLMSDPDKLASLSRLMAGCPDAVVFIDCEARIAWWNGAASEMFGYPLAEVVGHNVSLLMPEPFRAEHDGYIERHERTGEARIIGTIRTVEAKRRNGQVFPIELSITHLGTGDRARYGAFIRDASEKQRLHRELVERERLATLGLSASVFAHEVGNPLNNMALQAQLLEMSLRQQGHALSGPARGIVDEVRRLSGLLEDFRTCGRGEALELAAVDVPALMREVIAMKLDSGGCSNVRIDLEVENDEALPTVNGHRDKLKQVLVNLCKNALEAMPDGGRLTLRARTDGDTLTLAVEDTGGGLPSSVDVFQPFQSTKQGGVGLGLSIVRQIVEAHGGVIQYESKSGVGTRFIIDLPLEPIS